MAGKQVSVRLEPPRLILITGPAGTGKTTLSHILARRIGCPMISRDEIKEGMVLNTPGFEPAAGDPLTLATLDLFFDALTLLLRAGVTVIGEAAFQDHAGARASTASTCRTRSGSSSARATRRCSFAAGPSAVSVMSSTPVRTPTPSVVASGSG